MNGPMAIVYANLFITALLVLVGWLHTSRPLVRRVCMPSCRRSQVCTFAHILWQDAGLAVVQGSSQAL